MTAPLARAFNPTDPLPTGHHLLEASAGTGKTHAIVGLAIRYLAAGRCRAGQLLIVTFSRSASRELRGRLLARLEDTVDQLERAGANGAPPDGADEVASHVARQPPDERTKATSRLRTALADVDHATVTTIHGFCDDLLRRLGDPVLGTVLEDDRPLAAEIMGDLYLRMARASEWLGDELPYAGLHGLPVIRAGMRYPTEAIVPPRDMASLSGARAWMAVAAGIEARARKAAARLHDYDDLLHRLADRLGDPEHGAAIAAAVATRFTVGLVDEFQDTDPTQWRILTALFPDSSGADGRALVMVGDPKQSIYGFRGADVTTYLAARGERPDRTLVINWRSDRRLVDAVTTLFEGAPMGPGISSHDVNSRHGTRLDPPPDAPVHVRTVAPDAPIPSSRFGPRVGKAREFVAADTANHAVELLTAGYAVLPDDTDGPAGGSRPLAPDDIAVLVRTNAQAALVQRQLDVRGVPSVLNGVGNVLATPAARHWLAVLRALQQPANGRLARLAALTDLFGWEPARVATADPADRDELHIALHRMAEVVRRDGVAAGFRWLDAEQGVSPRLCARAGGNRRLADLLHLTELLNGEERASAHGLASLTTWLEAAMADAADPPPPDLARRLEQTTGAVQILTAHGAKGLEHRVALVPYLWDMGRPPGDVLVYVDPDDGRRKVDVGGRYDNPGRARRKDLADQESEQEEMRLAYVAATRAQHHLVLWWMGAGSAKRSPLSILLARGSGVTASTEVAMRRAEQLVADHPQAYAHTVVEEWPPVEALDARRPTQPGPPAALDRAIDHGWRRYSYSRLVTEADTETPRTPDDAVPARGDAVDEPGPPAPADDPERSGPVVPLSTMPGGAEVGTAIHSALEHVDFRADDVNDRLADQLRRLAVTSSVDLTDEPGVVEGLRAAIETPLGPVAGGFALRDVARNDRLDELAFELPVLSGRLADQPDTVLLTHVAELMAAHLPVEDPLAGYADVLRDTLGEVEVRGYLAGFVDLVARVPGPNGSTRFLVADYKTNRLGPPGVDDLRVAHYDHPSMAAAMLHNHYPLQALFYAVATHRYLRWRLPGYDPEVHLAGVAYLFLRGMTGPGGPTAPDNGTPHGVFAWTPPAALLLAVDRLLAVGPDDGGRR